MLDDQAVQSAIAIGKAKADETLARRAAARTRRAAALAANPAKIEMKFQLAAPAQPATAASEQTAGFLLAAGDSWFDYPFYDVLKELEDSYGYNVESSARAGVPIEKMAYVGGQLDQLARCLDKILARGAAPKAVLVSGGGDDIAGDEFGMLLNSAQSPIAGWNDEVVDGVLNRRIVAAYVAILTFITNLCQSRVGKTVPIFVHGYDYPVPDGRGVLGGWPFPGPWLEPGFREKLFTDLPNNVALMHLIIDRFNAMLIDLTSQPSWSHVHYINLRNQLSTDLTNDAYQDWWGNELHPTEQGFAKIADTFAAAIQALP